MATPVVEDDNDLNLVSLERAHKALNNGELETLRLGPIHGLKKQSLPPLGAVPGPLSGGDSLGRTRDK